MAIILVSLVILSLIALTVAFSPNLPFLQDSLGWRVSELRARIKYALSPPERVIFTPDPALATAVQQTLSALAPTPTPTQTSVPSPGPTQTPFPTLTPTPEPTAIPASVQLEGVKHEFQKWNNCGPANLAMALSYWGWERNQAPVAKFTKPNPRDKNVMPYEMEAFVEEQTRFSAITRVGGDLELLKRFIASGFPVLVEKGYEGSEFTGWMGHYQVVTGYDDSSQRFTTQDSYISSDFPVPYKQLERYWRNFNYTYIIVFPPEKEATVLQILGPHADEDYNLRTAADKASQEIFATSGRDLFFAWFNRGTNLVALQDFAGAAAAYDEAFNLYPSIPEGKRPWRLLWYQTGPYWAYYYTARYHDVISLATQTLDNMSEPVLEETYYWRALAREALGDIQGAIADLRTSLKYHANFEPSLYHLNRLGAVP